MTDPQSWVAPTYNGLADLLTSAPTETWDAPTLCEKWQVRHVVAHVTMPTRLTPAQFGDEMRLHRQDRRLLAGGFDRSRYGAGFACHGSQRLSPAISGAGAIRSSRRAACLSCDSPPSAPVNSPARPSRSSWIRANPFIAARLSARAW